MFFSLNHIGKFINIHQLVKNRQRRYGFLFQLRTDLTNLELSGGV